MLCLIQYEYSSLCASICLRLVVKDLWTGLFLCRNTVILGLDLCNKIEEFKQTTIIVVK